MTWMHYLVEANLYMAAFYVLYLIFLRSETHYQLNRAYLLSTSLLSFIIPFLQLGILKPGVEVLQQHISIGEPAITGYTMQVLPDSVAAATAPNYTLNEYLLFVYAGVAVVLLINLAIRVYLLIALARKGSVTQNASYKIIEMHQGSVAFSFFNNLFIDDRLASSQTILYHEQVHIRQKHSWDIIYLEIVKIINWFNPVVYLLIASIKEVHEFIADEETARLENGNDSYTDFLISNAYGITQNTLTNSFFNKNLLKRRITMLYQKKSGKAARLKYLLALPLICGLLCLSTLAFTTKTYGLVDVMPKTNQFEQNSSSPNYPVQHRLPITRQRIASSAKSDLQNNPGPVLTAVDVQPEFPGGEHALSQFLSRNLHYPPEDKANKVHGKVYAQFIVEPNGSISSVKIIRTPSAAMGAEVARLLKMSPKWKPGIKNGKPARVKFTIPVTFELTSTYLALGPPQPPQRVPGPPSKPGPLPKSVTVTEDDVHTNPNAVYNAVDAQPEFPGGEAALATFLQKNIRYPLLAKQNKIRGKVYIQFVVEKDGSLTDMKIVREPGSGTGDESIRVMKLSPQWTPGVLGGKNVRVQFTMPINFSLDNASGMLNPVKNPKTNDAIASTSVSTPPQFPGGQKVFEKFLAGSVLYPEQDRKNIIEGTVLTQFVIEKDGKLDNIKITQSPTKAMADEAVRVLTSSPKWTPGQQDGRAVRVAFNVPINFSLTAPSGLGNHIGNINMGKEADMPKMFYSMHDNMVRPQMVYIQVDKNFVNVVPNQPIEFGDHSVYLVDGKIYTKIDLERRSATISSNDRITTLFHAQVGIYHKPNNKEDIDKYGDIAKEGMMEFKNVVSSNL